jgi:hypothetical protein
VDGARAHAAVGERNQEPVQDWVLARRAARGVLGLLALDDAPGGRLA